MTGPLTTEVSVLSLADGSRSRRGASVVTEGPLQIRVAGQPPLVVLRTPGDDLDLTAGTLVGRGLAARASDVTSIRVSDGGGPDEDAAVDVTLAPEARTGMPREVPRAEPGHRPVARFDPEIVGRLPGRLGSALWHAGPDSENAVGLFLPNGDLLCARQDVSLRNAVDKAVGWALREDLLPLRRCLLLVLGGMTAEVVQAAIAADIRVVASAHAPTSLAIELAEDAGLTLLGQVQESSMNVYAGDGRLRRPGSGPAGGCGEPWALVRSQDGSMRIDVSSATAWGRLCAALGVDPSLVDPRDGGEPLEVVTARWTTAELQIALEAEGVTAAVVSGLDIFGTVQ
jgi:FdhD protein